MEPYDIDALVEMGAMEKFDPKLSQKYDQSLEVIVGLSNDIQELKKENEQLKENTLRLAIKKVIEDKEATDE